MTTPVRIQLSRAKGFNLQEASRAVNGLAAVKVARPTKWGNPWPVDELAAAIYETGFPYAGKTAMCGFILAASGLVAPHMSVELYRTLLRVRMASSDDTIIGPAQFAQEIEKLRGKNLACWCSLDKPCHADILLEIAND